MKVKIVMALIACITLLVLFAAVQTLRTMHLHKQVDLLEKQTSNQENAITHLIKERERERTIIDGLSENLETVKNEDIQTRVKLDKVEKYSEVVKDYLYVPIPDDVAKLLQGTGDQIRDAKPAPNIDHALRPSAEKRIESH